MKKVTIKVAQLMECAIIAGMPLVSSNIASANSVANSNVEIAKNKTVIKFDPNNKLTKQALNKVQDQRIKSVDLITLNGQKKTVTPMSNSKGVFVSTLNGNQSGTKYQYAVKFDNGETYTMNDPTANNAKNELYSVIPSTESSSNKSETNITITTPDGTVIDISGSQNANSASASIVSSSKISSSKEESSSSSLNNQNSSSIKASSSLSSIVSSSQDKSTDSSSETSNKLSLLKSNMLGTSNENSKIDSNKDMSKVLNVSSNKDSNENSNKDNTNTTNAPVKETEGNGNTTTTRNNGANTPINDKQQQGHAAVTQKDVSDSSSSKVSSSELSSSSSSLSSESQQSSGEKGTMPQTGENVVRGLSIAGGISLISALGIMLHRKWIKK